MAGRERLAVGETCPGQRLPGPEKPANTTPPAKTGPEQQPPTDLINAGTGPWVMAAKERPRATDKNACRPWPRSAGDAAAVHSVLLFGRRLACCFPLRFGRAESQGCHAVGRQSPSFRSRCSGFAEGRERVILRQ